MQIAYSLSLSYLLLGTAIGLVLWYSAERILNRNNHEPYSQRIIIIAAVLAVIGIVFAMGHLGRMERFMNLIMNPQSWLSREGFFAGAFTGSLILYLIILLKGKQNVISKIDPLIYLSAVAGVCTLISMGMIYASVEAVPAWNTVMIVMVDILSSILLGGLLYMVVAGSSVPSAIYTYFIKGILVILLISIFVNLSYEAHISMALQSIAAQGILVPSVGITVLFRLLIGLIVPAYFVVQALKKVPNLSSQSVTVALVCVLAGEVTAKIMHFIVAVKSPFL